MVAYLLVNSAVSSAAGHEFSHGDFVHAVISERNQNQIKSSK